MGCLKGKANLEKWDALNTDFELGLVKSGFRSNEAA
jgi:hypothetical protein